MKTPWQKVHQKFGMTPAGLARELGCHRSKLSRKLADDLGLITGKDQALIFTVAKRLNVEISADDVTPDRV